LYNLGEYTYLQPVIDYYQHAFRLPNQATQPRYDHLKTALDTMDW